MIFLQPKIHQVFKSVNMHVLPLQTGAEATEFYKDSDLTLGAVLNVWGRKFLISDCDNFTKEYYRTKYGVGEYSLMMSGITHAGYPETTNRD